MKKFFKIVLILLSVLAFGIACLLTYVKLALPDVGPAPDLKVEITPERVERGRYLANHVSVCIDCHSARDWSQFSGPAIEGTFGKGGEIFDRKFGFPGTFYSKNITPAGVGTWTDGELFRAITSGVNKEGKALFPIMPHPAYGKMDEEDIKSIIAYLRTLKPIDHKVPESEPDFPMNFLINTIPQKPAFTKIPAKSDVVKYGEYLATAAVCIDCHTKQDKGEKIAGMEYAGGFEFPMPGGIVRSANITPDKETGIGEWSRQTFIRKFKMYRDSSYQSPEIAPGEYNTVMPWVMYSGMSEEDLGALYEYLMTLKPIKNEVEKFTAKK